MIVTTRTVTCNFCGEWAHVDDDETAREARKRLSRRGWRTLPNADQGGRLMDACPRHPTPAPAAVSVDAGHPANPDTHDATEEA